MEPRQQISHPPLAVTYLHLLAKDPTNVKKCAKCEMPSNYLHSRHLYEHGILNWRCVFCKHLNPLDKK